jgi:hypothetical protein
VSTLKASDIFVASASDKPNLVRGAPRISFIETYPSCQPGKRIQSCTVLSATLITDGYCLAQHVIDSKQVCETKRTTVSEKRFERQEDIPGISYCQ